MTHTQVALDQCTGSFILKLRAASVSMHDSYRRVEDYRALAVTACATIALCPEAKEALTLALEAEAGIEKGIQFYWLEQKGVWSVELNDRCKLGRGPISAGNFPDFPFSIIKPEEGLFVNTPLENTFQKPQSFQLRIQKKSLVSQAIAFEDGEKTWQVKWNE